ncbi:hypothetical protein GUJ93_ZPchr0007g4257 [Zizania palustris]|uniref:Uncharacterized protein n=1 Tax=Zizania palustris TaxID=103762 RepID=A0A8J5T658_ZIZPA|nr:hypothetical protein GUJ93_ZPchr0007g4257 [Zizania palustris]
MRARNLAGTRVPTEPVEYDGAALLAAGGSGCHREIAHVRNTRRLHAAVISSTRVPSVASRPSRDTRTGRTYDHHGRYHRRVSPVAQRRDHAALRRRSC